MEELRVEAVHRLAVLRANGLGDLMFALPALRALRHAYPSAEITLLAGDWQRDFLSGRKIVHRVIEVPPCEGVRDGVEDTAQLHRFFRAMRGERFDIVLQMHGGGRFSNPFVQQLGARVTAGLQSRDAVPLDRVVPYVYFQSEVHRYLEVASLVGAAPVALEPRLPVLESDLAEARAVLGVTPRPFVVMNPGATDPRRRWPEAKFAAVADDLARAGAEVVLSGSPADASTVDAVRRSMTEKARDLCGALTLNGLEGLLALADVVVSNDSGPLHLAAAVGTPTVGIFWCGNLVNAGRYTRSDHRPLLSWRLDCPQCGADTTKARCEHAVSFVADVEIEAVRVEARDLLANATARSGAGGAAASAVRSGRD